MTQLEQNGSHGSVEKEFRADQIEERQVGARPAGFGGKVKRHCARWWWVHLIIFCICFLIIALCLVYVGMPRIAQHGVDDTTLEFTELKFLDPTPDSLSLSQTGIVHNPITYTPTLDPFNASLYLVTNNTFAQDRIMQITIPQIHAMHPTSQSTVVSQTVHIENMDQLTDYSTQVLKNEWIETALTGKTKLHLGKLPVVTVDFNSTSKYKGLNGLQGFNVTGVKINLAAKAGQPNLQGFAYIPNPSVMTIAMGNVTLTISTAKSGVVGNSTINDMTLVPGNNTLPMTGILDQGKILASLEKDGTVEMLITGKDAIYNGQHLVYYEKALASNNLTLTMNVTQILSGGL